MIYTNNIWQGMRLTYIYYLLKNNNIFFFDILQQIYYFRLSVSSKISENNTFLKLCLTLYYYIKNNIIFPSRARSMRVLISTFLLINYDINEVIIFHKTLKSKCNKVDNKLRCLKF